LYSSIKTVGTTVLGVRVGVGRCGTLLKHTCAAQRYSSSNGYKINYRNIKIRFISTYYCILMFTENKI